jgi:hypothetical protein
VIALIDAGFIKKDPATLARVAKTIELPLDILRDAWRRRVDGKVYPITPRRVEVPEPVLNTVPEPEPVSLPMPMPAQAEDPEPEWLDKMTPGAKQYRARRKAEKEPVEGMRRCSSHWHKGATHPT